MTHSDQIDQIATAGAKAQLELHPAVKDAINPAFRSKYANEAAVREAAKVYAKYGIASWQDATTTEHGVSVVTKLTHSSGQWMEFGPLTVPMGKQDAHSVGSATTYAKRYALSAALGIASEEDDDGVAATDARPAPVAHALVRDWQTPATPTDAIPHKAVPRPVAAPAASGPMISEPQAKRFYAIAKKAGWVDRDLADWLQAVWHVSSTAQIRRHDYEKICTDVARGPDADVQT